MAETQKEQGEKLERLESRDGEMWRKVTSYIITAIIGIGYCHRPCVSANRYITEFLIDECRGGQELILAALKLFKNFSKRYVQVQNNVIL